MKSSLRKIALLFPAVRDVRTDLHNRRIRADEFEAAHRAIEARNHDLLSKLDFMKSQMAEALDVKDAAVLTETALERKADHYEGQLKVMTAKYDKLKLEFDAMESENCILRLTNDDLTRKIAVKK